MAVETFNRYEHKYLLNEQTYKKVISALKSHIKADSHNNDSKPYTISNIYYDTDEDYLIRTSISKPEYKEKLRFTDNYPAFELTFILYQMMLDFSRCILI